VQAHPTRRLALKPESPTMIGATAPGSNSPQALQEAVLHSAVAKLLLRMDLFLER